MSMSRRTLSALVLALVASTSLSAASVHGSFQRTFQVSGPVDLEVLTRSGDITVHSGPAGTVSVNGKIHVGDRWFEGNRQSDVSELEKNPPVRQSGNSIHIDYVNLRNISIDYDITVPADTAVRAQRIRQPRDRRFAIEARPRERIGRYAAQRRERRHSCPHWIRQCGGTRGVWSPYGRGRQRRHPRRSERKRGRSRPHWLGEY